MNIKQLILTILSVCITLFSLSQHYYEWWESKPNLKQDSVILKKNNISKIKILHRISTSKLNCYLDKTLETVVFPFENKTFNLTENDTIYIKNNPYVYKAITKGNTIIVTIKKSNTDAIETHIHYLNNKNQILKTITDEGPTELGNEIYYFYKDDLLVKAEYVTKGFSKEHPWKIVYYEYPDLPLFNYTKNNLLSD